jgi:copper(I)-binding protein
MNIPAGFFVFVRLAQRQSECYASRPLAIIWIHALRRSYYKIFVALLCAELVLAAGPLHVQARDYSAGQLVIAHPWAPPSLGKQRIGVAYFTVRNSGVEADRLLGVELPQGGQAQMHNSQMQDGVMRMRPADAPEIPAGGELVLRPGAMHVMLMDLPGPLIEGDGLKLILRFEKAGPVEMEAAVEPRPSTPSPHQGH